MKKNNPLNSSFRASDAIVEAIRQCLSNQKIVVVSLDGGSGAGKTTLAIEVASQVDATIIHCDDFFDATISNAEWETASLEKRCCRCIDWSRLQKEVLYPLINGETVYYHPFSFENRNGVSSEIVEVIPTRIIILDGIYSSLLNLFEVGQLKILVDVVPDLRYKRHNQREGTDDLEWHQLWDSVEEYYFTFLRPPETFDLIVQNA